MASESSLHAAIIFLPRAVARLPNAPVRAVACTEEAPGSRAREKVKEAESNEAHRHARCAEVVIDAVLCAHPMQRLMVD